MNCAEVQELLSAYYDSELSSDERIGVAAHLADCPACSRALAGFGKISGMVHSSPTSIPAQLDWRQVQNQLAPRSTVQPAEQVTTANRSRRHWLSLRGLRPAVAIAAILLIAIGWFAFDTWFTPGSHNLLAADIDQYVAEFQHDPLEAQQVLVSKYNGRRVDLSEAVKHVSYRPAVASGLPDSYAVQSMYILKMPCCDCLQTICQRSDGSKFAIFEYGEEHPTSIGMRSGGMAQCAGKNCCLVDINTEFAASWKKGDRHVSLVGVRDQAEVQDLMSRFN